VILDLGFWCFSGAWCLAFGAFFILSYPALSGFTPSFAPPLSTYSRCSPLNTFGSQALSPGCGDTPPDSAVTTPSVRRGGFPARQKNFWCDVGTDADTDAALAAEVDRLLQPLPDKV
jgi:hypothetical protein